MGHAPLCPGGDGGRLSLGVSVRFKHPAGQGGFREGKSGNAQGSLPTPCLWGGRSWKGRTARSGWERALPALGASESLGVAGCRQDPLIWWGRTGTLFGGESRGVQPGNAALVGSLEDAVCLARGRLAPGAIQGAPAQHIPVPAASQCHAPPRLAPWCLGFFLSAPSSSSGASTALSAASTRTGLVLRFFLIPPPLSQPPSLHSPVDT